VLRCGGDRAHCVSQRGSNRPDGGDMLRQNSVAVRGFVNTA
jgi:hypothetical protein